MQKNWTKVMILVLALVVVAGAFTLISGRPVSRADQDLKSTVGYVNIEKIFVEHPDKPKAEQQFNTEYEAMLKEYEEKKKDLSEEEQRKLLAEYQNRLALREKELINTIIQKIRTEIEEVAKAKGVTVVLEQKNIIYGGTDLTEDVLAKIKAESE